MSDATATAHSYKLFLQAYYLLTANKETVSIAPQASSATSHSYKLFLHAYYLATANKATEAIFMNLK